MEKTRKQFCATDLAGGLGLQYADRDLGADEKAFYEENMSAVLLFSGRLPDQSGNQFYIKYDPRYCR